MEKFSPSSLVSVTTSAHARTKFVCLFVFHSFPLLLSQWRNIQQWDKKKIQKYLWMYIYICVYIYIHAQSLQSCLTLWDPIVYSLPGSSFHGVLQTRILEWVVTPSSRGSSRPRDGTHVSMSPVLAGEFFTTKTTWEEHLGDTHTHTHTHTYGKEPACQYRRHNRRGFDPWIGTIPWRRKLQYSCLENPTDRGAWWTIVHRVAKSQTQLTLCIVT